VECVDSRVEMFQCALSGACGWCSHCRVVYYCIEERRSRKFSSRCCDCSSLSTAKRTSFFWFPLVFSFFFSFPCRPPCALGGLWCFLFVCFLFLLYRAISVSSCFSAQSHPFFFFCLVVVVTFLLSGRGEEMSKSSDVCLIPFLLVCVRVCVYRFP
jgi:hypothetical protein